MPLDPSIITNSMSNMAANMPDVNALMQQRVQGAENIYKIQTAREEQAKLAQKEAAEKAAKAMLPAVSAAFSDPSDAGLDAATSLLPPDVASAFTPFMQRLKGIPDAKQRTAILRAELAKDDEGRFILGQLEPSANMQLQAATAAQRAAIDMRRLTLDEQKQALDAEGKGAWELKEGEGGFFWTNPRTREVVPANVTGAVPSAAPGSAPVPAPGVVAPQQPVPAAPEVAAPAGTEQPKAEFKPKPKDGKTSESERVAAYNAGRTLLSAADIFNTIKSDPDAVAPGALETAVGLFVDPNFVRSAERQIVSSAQYEAVDALLTLATGAAYNQEQRNSQIQRYIPLYSDKPETREYKKRALLDTIQVAKAKSGAAWTPEMDAALEKLGLVDDTGTGGAAPAAADASGFKIRSVREK